MLSSFRIEQRKGFLIMHSPLRYQATEYDCGPTAITNAIMFLFDREEIPPDLIRHIGQGTLDSFDEKGHCGRYGTSGAAIRYFGSWLNELRYAGLLPIESCYLEKDDVQLGEGSRLTEGLKNGAAAVLHVSLHGYGHYILLTGMEGHSYRVFDPYYSEERRVSADVTSVSDQPFSHNLLVSEERLNSIVQKNYAMGDIQTREALFIYRHRVEDFYVI